MSNREKNETDEDTFGDYESKPKNIFHILRNKKKRNIFFTILFLCSTTTIGYYLSHSFIQAFIFFIFALFVRFPKIVIWAIKQIFWYLLLIFILWGIVKYFQ